jgi:hypothetical protein
MNEHVPLRSTLSTKQKSLSLTKPKMFDVILHPPRVFSKLTRGQIYRTESNRADDINTGHADTAQAQHRDKLADAHTHTHTESRPDARGRGAPLLG